ncbi:MAG: hypothetical protein Q9195_009115 [Heterodermia aff. obscurata]
MINVVGESCQFCQKYGLQCSSATFKRPSFALKSSARTDDNTHIVGPVVARDTQVLDSLLDQVKSTGPGQAENLSETKNKAIYRAPMPVRRPSLDRCDCSGDLWLEFISAIEPSLDHLIAKFFENIHPAFPFLDETFVFAQLAKRDLSPQPFFVNLLTLALFYRPLSPALTASTLPDQDSAWKLALAAMNREIQSSGVLTIATAVLNVTGRPSQNVILNTVTIARMVALSNSIGLNQDCSTWKLSESEKVARLKLWWTVFIHDVWFNFARGTPSCIKNAEYDVRLPDLETLVHRQENSNKQIKATECYIQLCRLTEIVGDALLLTCDFRPRESGFAEEKISKSEIDLSKWLANLPDWMNLQHPEKRPTVLGLANLQFSYLATHMLLCRLRVHEAYLQSSASPSFWLLSCQKSAEAIADFVASLQPSILAGFWLPYNAHHFSSAVTLLLRCALQTEDARFRIKSMVSARQLVDRLRKYKSEDGWDLAGTSLFESETMLRRIEQALSRYQKMQHHEISAGTESQDTFDDSVGDQFWDNPALEQEGFGISDDAALQDLFPEIFSGFGEATFQPPLFPEECHTTFDC